MHQTEIVIINGENIEIDCLMVPFIKWLNKLSSVRTQFCCEGDQKTGCLESGMPYVILTCDDEDLRLILRKIQPEAIGEVKNDLCKLFPDTPIQEVDQIIFARCEITMDTVSKRYKINFIDRGNLIKFNEFMRFVSPQKIWSLY